MRQGSLCLERTPPHALSPCQATFLYAEIREAQAAREAATSIETARVSLPAVAQDGLQGASELVEVDTVDVEGGSPDPPLNVQAVMKYSNLAAACTPIVAFVLSQQLATMKAVNMWWHRTSCGRASGLCVHHSLNMALVTWLQNRALARLKMANKERDTFKMDLGIMESACSAIKLECCALREECAIKQEECSSLQMDSEALLVEYGARQAECATLRAECEALRETNGATEAELAVLRGDSNACKTENEELGHLRANNSRLRAEVTALEVAREAQATDNARHAKLQSECSILRAEVATLEMSHQTLNLEHAALQQAHEEILAERHATTSSGCSRAECISDRVALEMQCAVTQRALAASEEQLVEAEQNAQDAVQQLQHSQHLVETRLEEAWQVCHMRQEARCMAEEREDAAQCAAEEAIRCAEEARSAAQAAEEARQTAEDARAKAEGELFMAKKDAEEAHQQNLDLEEKLQQLRWELEETDAAVCELEHDADTTQQHQHEELQRCQQELDECQHELHWCQQELQQCQLMAEDSLQAAHQEAAQSLQASKHEADEAVTSARQQAEEAQKMAGECLEEAQRTAIEAEESAMALREELGAEQCKTLALQKEVSSLHAAATALEGERDSCQWELEAAQAQMCEVDATRHSREQAMLSEREHLQDRLTALKKQNSELQQHFTDVQRHSTAEQETAQARCVKAEQRRMVTERILVAESIAGAYHAATARALGIKLQCSRAVSAWAARACRHRLCAEQQRFSAVEQALVAETACHVLAVQKLWHQRCCAIAVATWRKQQLVSLLHDTRVLHSSVSEELTQTQNAMMSSIALAEQERRHHDLLEEEKSAEAAQERMALQQQCSDARKAVEESEAQRDREVTAVVAEFQQLQQQHEAAVQHMQQRLAAQHREGEARLQEAQRVLEEVKRDAAALQQEAHESAHAAARDAELQVQEAQQAAAATAERLSQRHAAMLQEAQQEQTAVKHAMDQELSGLTQQLHCLEEAAVQAWRHGNQVAAELEDLQRVHASDNGRIRVVNDALEELREGCKDTCGRHNIVLAHVLAQVPREGNREREVSRETMVETSVAETQTDHVVHESAGIRVVNTHSQHPLGSTEQNDASENSGVSRCAPVLAQSSQAPHCIPGMPSTSIPDSGYSEQCETSCLLDGIQCLLGESQTLLSATASGSALERVRAARAARRISAAKKDSEEARHDSFAQSASEQLMKARTEHDLWKEDCRDPGARHPVQSLAHAVHHTIFIPIILRRWLKQTLHSVLSTHKSAVLEREMSQAKTACSASEMEAKGKAENQLQFSKQLSAASSGATEAAVSSALGYLAAQRLAATARRPH